MKIITSTILLLLSISSWADNASHLISPKYCSAGPHFQPDGRFALYVFCDDALGSNVAVYLNSLDGPMSGKYSLGKRFWQEEEWSYDVTSYYWLSNDRYLLIATSAIYGSGKLYRLDLQEQTSEILFQGENAVIEIDSVDSNEVILKVYDSNDNHDLVTISFKT